MLKQRARSLSLYNWVRYRDRDIVRLGLDPYDRLRLAGHEHALNDIWLNSVGLWGDLEPAEVLREAEPWKAVVAVSSNAFRQFKSRHRLMTRSQFQRVHGPMPWRRAELSFELHERAQRLLAEANGFHPAIGIAVAFATSRMERGRPKKSAGLFNVEVVVGVQLFAAVLASHGITYVDWAALDDDVKLELWEQSRDEGLCDFEKYLHRPAVRHLDGFDDFAQPTAAQQASFCP